MLNINKLRTTNDQTMEKINFVLYFCTSKHKRQRTMEENTRKTPVYKRMKDICVDMYTQEEAVEKRILHGRALLNTEKGEFMFAQNEPRKKRSKEIGRFGFGRLVRRPDGLYTLSFTAMDGGTRNLREILLAAVREAMKRVEEDMNEIKRKEVE